MVGLGMGDLSGRITNKSVLFQELVGLFDFPLFPIYRRNEIIATR